MSLRLRSCLFIIFSLKSLWWFLLLNLGFTSFQRLFWGEKRTAGDSRVFKSRSCHLWTGRFCRGWSCLLVLNTWVIIRAALSMQEWGSFTTAWVCAPDYSHKSSAILREAEENNLILKKVRILYKMNRWVVQKTPFTFYLEGGG